MNVDAALTYLDFVRERHRVWEARQLGLPPEQWTDDPIVRERKFTNVFRVLDPGSQYVLTDLWEPDLREEDLLLRLFLYRHTGRVDAWQWLSVTSGLPTRENLGDVLEAWRQYRGPAKVRTRRSDPRAANRTTQVDYVRSVFTGAYLVFPQSQVPGTDKMESIVDLTKRLFVDTYATPAEFLRAKSQQDRFRALRSNKGVGDFMAMQVLTDWGYFTEDRENDFVVPGPGARKGAAVLGLQAQEACHWAHQQLDSLSISITMGDGRRRAPSLMDAQNTLCEYSKYARYLGQPLRGQPYTPAHPGPQDPPVLPVRW